VTLCVPLAVLAFHWRAAAPGMAFVGSDLRIFFFGVREAVAEALRSGSLPSWQRGMFMGYPLAADPQAAVFDFATWLTLPWEAPRALTLATLLHLVVAGWGMAFWMRRRGLGPLEALLAAVLFALGAKQTVHILHWNFAASTAWWPWMLGGLEAFASAGRGRHLALVALASAASWLGGSPQLAHFGSLAAGLYALTLAPDLWRRRPLDAVLAVAAVPMGLLLAAPAMLPALELARLGPRGSGVSYQFATSWKWPDRWALALFVLPRAYHWRWGLNLWEATGYLGILPVGLAAAAPLRRRGVPLFLALGILGVWLGFGEDSWLGLHRVLYDFLPGYGAFRVPTRFLMVTSFSSALLAAEGLAAIRREGRGARAWRCLSVLGAMALLALVLPRLAGFPFAAATARATAWTAVALAAGGAALLLFGHAARGRALALGAVALAATDLTLAFAQMNAVGPARRERAVLGEFAPLVPLTPAPRRVGVVALWGASANATLRLGWEGTLGYGPSYLDRVGRLLAATRGDRLTPPGPVTDDTNFFPRVRPTSRLWPLFGTPLVVSDQILRLPRLMVGEREWYARLVAYRAEALPRVFWAGAWSVVPDPALDGPLLEAAAGDRAVLAEALPGLPPPGEPEGPVAAEEVRLGNDWLEATVLAPRDGVAVVLDPFYPGWRATLDGAPVPLARADYAFMAVPVKAGRHALRLEFHDRLVPLGLAAGAAALLAWLGLLGLRRRLSRSRPIV
jgi:membrane protein YfhO